MGVNALLLDLLHESYDRVAWHGPNLGQALNGVDARQANWRPLGKEARLWNIREIVLHVGRVMEEAGASLLGSKNDGALVVNESLFPLPDLADDEEWRQELDFLQKSFEMLRRAISESTPARLQEISPFKFYKREWTFVNHVYGVTFHNVYHAAQLVSVRKRQQTWTDLS